jgi:two-component system response regulator GlrR
VRADIVEEAKPKLLLIDDDECLLRLMSIRLEGEGFNVTSVNNATHALRLTYNNKYDVVLSDLRMPGMDGLSLFEEILQKHRDLPVILMTAHGTIKDAVAATQRGVYSFITKPVDHKELRQTLLKAV